MAFGLVAVVLWSSYAALMVAMREVPAFLLLAIAFSSASLVMLARRLVLGMGFRDLVAIPRATLALGVMGLFGTNALFALALRTGVDTVSATIINYSWPVLMVLVVHALRIARPTPWDGLALTAGFAGVVVAALKEGTFIPHPGLILSFTSALLWAAYSGARRLVPPGPTDALAAFAVVSAALSWGCHFAFEAPTLPALSDLALIVAVGVVPLGIGNAFWDVAARHADPILLAGLSFLEPIMATWLLLLYLGTALKAADLISLGLVVGGVGLGILGDFRRRAGAPVP